MLKYLILAIGIASTQTFASNFQDESEISKQVPAFMSQEIVDAYEANTIAADRKFKGKMIVVGGVVESVATNFSGDPYVTFTAKNRWHSPRLYFEKTERELDKLANFSVGQKIVSICVGGGDVQKSPILKECTIVDGK
ncbi:OB-fold protein [Yersinia sp. 2540 StPb PI]|uniref:OB-fold protein n=1 Tax=Yersinia sp. 2540 StPb PI TaxID=3117406 RepID=UPI003FA45311